MGRDKDRDERQDTQDRRGRENPDSGGGGGGGGVLTMFALIGWSGCFRTPRCCPERLHSRLGVVTRVEGWSGSSSCLEISEIGGVKANRKPPSQLPTEKLKPWQDLLYEELVSWTRETVSAGPSLGRALNLEGIVEPLRTGIVSVDSASAWRACHGQTLASRGYPTGLGDFTGIARPLAAC